MQFLPYGLELGAGSPVKGNLPLAVSAANSAGNFELRPNLEPNLGTTSGTSD